MAVMLRAASPVPVTRVAPVGDPVPVIESVTYLPRSGTWAELGVWVGSSPPADPVTYAEWLAGTGTYWGWIEV